VFGPRFDVAVSRGGYAWWYLDALSDDGRDACTLIAFVGSVFSPYYAAARRRGRAQPEEHCAVNLALRGQVNRWAMTERGSSALGRSAAALRIGSSVLRWERGALRAEFDERTAPWPFRLRGHLSLTPEVVTDFQLALDPAGLHRWQPIAPRARLELHLERPSLHWFGTGYLDFNAGDAPLEDTFRRWDWSREERVGDRAETVLYDVEFVDGRRLDRSFSIGADGAVVPAGTPRPCRLPDSRWGLERRFRAEPHRSVRLARVLEDGPFYARAEVALQGPDGPSRAVHETLSLERFSRPWVQALLPFRMPRVPAFLDARRR
jgi:carotenoid 1,2-hydratase